MQLQNITIKDFLTKHNIPFKPLGNDLVIVCPFKPEMDGAGCQLLTFNVNQSSGNSFCAYCRKTAEFDEVLRLLNIPAPIAPSATQSPEGAQIPPSVPDRDAEEPEPEPKKEALIDVSHFEPMAAETLLQTLGITIKRD